MDSGLHNRTHNPLVGGSNPPGATKPIKDLPILDRLPTFDRGKSVAMASSRDRPDTGLKSSAELLSPSSVAWRTAQELAG